MINFSYMYPVLFSILGYQITSFGIFLILGLLSALFVLWRLVHIYEIDQEKVLDIFFITALASFIGARALYIVTHLNDFDSFTKMVFFFKHSGLSFWGALLLGIITLRLIVPKFKLNIWQIADLGIVATYMVISVVSFGCLFGGCQFGLPYDGWFAVNQFGLPGSRFPLQLIESGLFLLGFIYLWHASLRFHFNGKIASTGIITLAVIKLILEPLRGDAKDYFFGFSYGTLFGLFFLAFGIFIFYRQSKRSVNSDLKFISGLLSSQKKRVLLISKLRRNWYNFYVKSNLSINRWRKNVGKQFRIKSTPTKF